MQQSLNLALARWVLGLVRSDELPAIAVEFVSHDFDGPSLRLLAGELQPTMIDCGKLFERALAEMAVALPTRREAGLLLSRDYAGKIVDGELTPQFAAKRIWWDVHSEVEELKPELDPFVYWASEWESADDDARKMFCEDAIRSVAKEFLDP